MSDQEQNKAAAALAVKIQARALQALEPVQLEMTLMHWRPEFRTILWHAIARHAFTLALEAEREAEQATRDKHREP